MDYYEILGIGPKASPAEIALAHRNLAGRTTPEIERAHGVLSNPHLREEYDRRLEPRESRNAKRPWSRLLSKVDRGLLDNAALLAVAALFIILIPGTVYLSGGMAFQLRDAGNVALAQGDLNEALRNHRQAVAINHSDPDYRADLGRTYLALARPGEALTQYVHALEMEPEHPEALLGRTRAMEAMGADQARDQAKD